MSWETWSFAFNVTVPNLLMMLLGILLRHWRLMDDRFVDGATRLVFNLALPCLLFFSIATNHPQLLGNLPLVLFGAVGTLAANIIAITTVGSFFTTALGIYFLRSWGAI
ncbi:AEC family transporter [Serratia bockelmannii]|uniref:AEC family transporter n=1 Tax=Serratia bockelmannii TaxID=2703793 RepID=UPI00368ABF74